MDKTYQTAIQLLNNKRRLRRPSNDSERLPGLSPTTSLNGEPSLKGTPSLLGMRQWLCELGHSAGDINGLHVIHVAGTKGKGSTCAFIDSFLRAHGRRTGFPTKVGLYTSPHLIHPEERIRINFEPLPRSLFAKYFFEVENVLSRHDPLQFHTRPRYLQLFTLLSLHTFLREGVDAAIIETHHGGEYDSTNVVEKPVITAITTLGLDHVKQLGSSIEKIAWHKSGIFKSGALAFSAPQQPSAEQVLIERAAEKDVILQFIRPDLSLPEDLVQLKPSVQRTNCSVALAATRAFLHQKQGTSPSTLSSSDIIQGISQFSWPGRFQLVVENQFQWFLDGAHNEMSVVLAAEWFLDASRKQSGESPVARILIFSLITNQRDGVAVFECLAASLAGSGIQHAIFTTYERDQDYNSQRVQETESMTAVSQIQPIYAEIWKRFHPGAQVFIEPTIDGALGIARKIGGDHGSTQTLVTGSQHLVGGALSLLQNTKHHGIE